MLNNSNIVSNSMVLNSYANNINGSTNANSSMPI